MARHRCTTGVPEPRQDVDDSWREAGFDSKLGDAEDGERSKFGWFEEDRVACGNGGSNFEASHNERSIPWDDSGNDSDPVRGARG